MLGALLVSTLARPAKEIAFDSLFPVVIEVVAGASVDVSSVPGLS
jgi:hypothetical protein